MVQDLAPAGGSAGREDGLSCWKRPQIIRPRIHAQPDLAARRLVERFGLSWPMARTVAGLAGLGPMAVRHG